MSTRWNPLAVVQRANSSPFIAPSRLRIFHVQFTPSSTCLRPAPTTFSPRRSAPLRLALSPSGYPEVMPANPALIIMIITKGARLVITRDEVPYQLLSLGTGLLGGAIAGALVTRIWRAFSGSDELPNPTALERHNREVLIASAIQGAVFGLVKAALSRLTAKGYWRVTRASAV